MKILKKQKRQFKVRSNSGFLGLSTIEILHTQNPTPTGLTNGEGGKECICMNTNKNSGGGVIRTPKGHPKLLF